MKIKILMSILVPIAVIVLIVGAFPIFAAAKDSSSSLQKTFSGNVNIQGASNATYGLNLTALVHGPNSKNSKGPVTCDINAKAIVTAYIQPRENNGNQNSQGNGNKGNQQIVTGSDSLNKNGIPMIVGGYGAYTCSAGFNVKILKQYVNFYIVIYYNANTNTVSAQLFVN